MAGQSEVRQARMEQRVNAEKESATAAAKVAKQKSMEERKAQKDADKLAAQILKDAEKT